MKSKKQSSNGSCMITCLKGIGILVLFSLLLGFGWIAGIVWLLFFRKKSNDDPKKRQLKTIVISTLSAFSFILMVYSIVTHPQSESLPIASNMTDLEQTVSQDYMLNNYSPELNAVDNNFENMTGSDKSVLQNNTPDTISGTEIYEVSDFEYSEPHNDTTTFEQTREPANDNPDVFSIGNDNNNFDTYNNTEQQQTAANYVLNNNSKKIHYPSCSSVPKIAPQNYATSNQTVEELIALGYTTCGICFK